MVNVAKRRVAERRRSLRNERMATIDYDELIRRLATLVECSPAIGEIALDDIAKLYQVRAPAALPPIRRHLGRHYCGARPGSRRSGSISWSDRLTNVLTNEGYTLSACSASATPASAVTRQRTRAPSDPLHNPGQTQDPGRHMHEPHAEPV